MKEAFLHSPLYAKMQAIIKDHLDKDASDKEISDQEWQELIVSMDSLLIAAISASERVIALAASDRKSTRLNSSHRCTSRMPSSA